jgi:histidine ammonia-lyase
MDVFELTGTTLTPESLFKIGHTEFNKVQIVISEEAIDKILKCRKIIDNAVANEEVIYGVTTGFGNFAEKVIPVDKLHELQENLIRSHTVGVGEPAKNTIVRMLMILRLNTLCKGHSGISIEVIYALLDMINKGCYPLIPMKGTVGASGDLAPLSHNALSLIGEGTTWNPKTNAFENTQKVMFDNGLHPVHLKAKDGLSLINGTQFITSIGCEALVRGINIFKHAIIAAALNFEVSGAKDSTIDPRIHDARNHKWQCNVANIMRYLTGFTDKSELRKYMSTKSSVQDQYSIRCISQIFGATGDTIDFVNKIITTEINSATDNPMIFEDAPHVLSGGNFHGQYPAIALDTLCIAIQGIATSSERRLYKLLNGNDKLPEFLVADGGLNSGFMITQYTAAALVSENKILSHPSCTDTIPTSNGKEDHVSMGGMSARTAYEIVKNTEKIIAIDFMASCQAMDLVNKKSTPMIEQIKSYVRQYIATFNKDRVFSNDINTMVGIIKSKKLLEFVDDGYIFDNYSESIKQTPREKIHRVDYKVPKGTIDIAGKDFDKKNKIFSIIENKIKIFADVEGLETPVFELKKVLMGKYGDEAEKKQIYDLADTGDEKLSLRFDLTVPLSRHVIQNGKRKYKRYQYGKVYRKDYASIANGRYREFYQYDIDFVGDFGYMNSEIELLKLVTVVFDALHIENYMTKFNFRNNLNKIFEFASVNPNLYNSVSSSIDKLDKCDWDYITTELIEKGLTIDQVCIIQEKIKCNYMCEETAQDVEYIMRIMNVMGISNKVVFDCTLARGLDYYTGMILETVVTGATVGSILGGGRYDNMIKLGNNETVPAIGMSFGVSRLMHLVNFEERNKNRVHVAQLAGTSVEYKWRVINIIVNSNVSFTHSEGKNLKGEFAYCNENDIGLLIIIGENESANETVVIKDLNTRVQHTIKIDELHDYFADNA